MKKADVVSHHPGCICATCKPAVRGCLCKKCLRLIAAREPKMAEPGSPA